MILASAVPKNIVFFFTGRYCHLRWVLYGPQDLGAYWTKVQEICTRYRGFIVESFVCRSCASFPLVVKFDYRQWRQWMSTCCRLVWQNWLPWQLTLTEVRQMFSHSNFFGDGVNATICIAICPLVVEWEGWHKKGNCEQNISPPAASRCRAG